MFAVEAMYENGNVKFKVPPSVGQSKVIVTFLDADVEVPSKLDMSRFSFEKSKDLLKNLKSSLSDEIVKERRDENIS